METDSVARTANEEGNNGAARVSDPSRRTIDVRRYVAEMARTLCANGDQRACKRALATLERWQFDEMLDDESREEAKLLVLRFAR